MFSAKPATLPDAVVHDILIVRTATTPQVEWAIETLRCRYPDVRFSVLGTHLTKIDCFQGMGHFEPKEQWLSPWSCRSLLRAMRGTRFDMVVMCFNGDWGGYGRVSRVVRKVPARFKMVVDYGQKWHSWRHKDFEEGNFLIRGIVNFLGFIIYPAIAIYLTFRVTGATYMPDGQGRPAPGYEA